MDKQNPLVLKIASRIKEQVGLLQKMEALQKEIRDLEKALAQNIGALSAFSELYNETTGSDLQHELNTDPDWKGLIESARSSSEQGLTVVKTSQEDASPRPHALRRVSENKRPMPQAEPEEEVHSRDRPTDANRTRDAVKVQIVDAPQGIPSDDDDID